MSSNESQDKNRKSYSIPPEQVRKDNSDLFRYSTTLDKALRRERFTKAKPELFVDYCEAVGLLDLVNPFEDIDLRLDIEKYTEKLSSVDSRIFRLHLFRMTQQEIADHLGVSQSTVCNRLRVIKEGFALFYR